MLKKGHDLVDVALNAPAGVANRGARFLGVQPYRFHDFGIRQQRLANGAPVGELEPVQPRARAVKGAECHPAGTEAEKNHSAEEHQANCEPDHDRCFSGGKGEDAVAKLEMGGSDSNARAIGCGLAAPILLSGIATSLGARGVLSRRQGQ